METMVLAWAQGQSWFGIACTVIAVANAVTLTLKDDYAEAGVPMLPVVKGENVTRNHILGYCICLVLNSALIVIYGNTKNENVNISWELKKAS